MRDDLEFVLDEESSHIQLCSLHQEMRNTEQLLGSLGLFAHRIGTLKTCNEAVSVYCPENTRCFDHIRAKFHTGQQTAVTQSNIRVSSMSGEISIQLPSLQCKLWGFLLRHLFGVTLGMGDYAHLTVEHSAMLLREHRSFHHYSNQGFEASHTEQRILYSRATSHDSSSEGLSSE